MNETLNTIDNFFTQDEWELIFDALEASISVDEINPELLFGVGDKLDPIFRKRGIRANLPD